MSVLGQKTKVPAHKRAKKCCKNYCVLIPPPLGLLMDKKTNGRTKKKAEIAI